MRPTHTIELPSGIKAEIIDEWKFGEYEQIEAATNSSLRMVVDTENGNTVTPGDMTAATHLAMRLAIKSLVAPDGTALEVTDALIADLSMRDGMALRKAINTLNEDAKKA